MKSNVTYNKSNVHGTWIVPGHCSVTLYIKDAIYLLSNGADRMLNTLSILENLLSRLFKWLMWKSHAILRLTDINLSARCETLTMEKTLSLIKEVSTPTSCNNLLSNLSMFLILPSLFSLHEILYVLRCVAWKLNTSFRDEVSMNVHIYICTKGRNLFT